MSDLELGMNDSLSQPFAWDDEQHYDRGKVLDTTKLEEIGEFGRYLDIDGDGIGYRTLPGTHPTKGAFFTRGTSRDEYAIYTESPEAYTANMNRLLRKWDTAKTIVPFPEIVDGDQNAGIIYYGTTEMPMSEALDRLGDDAIQLDTMRLRAFPFGKAVQHFIDKHDILFVAEQNRDGQMRTLLVNELGIDPARLISILYYGGLSISADTIHEQILAYYTAHNLPRLKEVRS